MPIPSAQNGNIEDNHHGTVIWSGITVLSSDQTRRRPVTQRAPATEAGRLPCTRAGVGHSGRRRRSESSRPDHEQAFYLGRLLATGSTLAIPGFPWHRATHLQLPPEVD